jgi:ACS family hexuronate transporter-like MFS transporter
LFLFAGAWAIANMLHSLAVNWWQLTLCRGLLGAAEASVIPANLKVVGEWFPAKERSIATGWFNIGASVGAMLAPPLVVWCIRAYDWRFAFLVTGGLGLLWSGLWYASYRKPDTHFAITEAERDFIRRGQSKGPNDSNTRVSWRDIIASRSFWGLALGRFFAEPAWNTFIFWIPLYLKYFNDTLLTSRKLVALSGALLMAGPAFIGLAAAPGVAIGLFCVGGFAHQVLSGAILTTSSDVFPSHQLATANGLMGSAAWTGGLLFSLVVGGLATTLGYNPLFACLVGFDLLGVALFWWLVKPQDGPI